MGLLTVSCWRRCLIAAVAAQIFSSRVHSAAGLSISSIRMKSARYGLYRWGNASGFRADLGFPGLSKMLLFSALLCWALFMPLILWRIVFVRPVTPQKAMPGLGLLWFQRLSSPSDCTVFMAANDVIEFMARPHFSLPLCSSACAKNDPGYVWVDLWGLPSRQRHWHLPL